MIAAIYARKSTEQHGVSDEEKSITRQVEHAKAYAATKGWMVVDEHIYQDDGISGAEFVKRPGFLRLMNALKPRPSFQILIMSEESRLGRESIETSYALKQIIDAGVRVLFYMTDQERRLDSALDKVMLSLSNFASEMEREKASQRTHDAMARKAQAGYVTGCKVYGYDNVPVFGGVSGPDGQATRQHVVRRINETEAAVVRRIFDVYSSGLGLTRLAKSLNEDHIPPPRRGLHGWAPSAIREILHRELYRGIILWNRTQTVQRGGTRKQRRRPESEWLRLEAPELRIVSEDLWQKIQERTTRSRQGYLRSAGGRLLGRPSGEDLGSKYLLSGLAKCGICGGSLAAINRIKGRHVRKVYACAYYHKRGSTICTNSLQIRQEELDSAFFHALNEVLDERILIAAVEHALVQIRANQAHFPNHRIALERELSLIETRLHHLVEAVARGQATDALFANLRAEEDRKKAILRELDQMDSLMSIASLDAKRIAKNLESRLGDVKGLLSRHVPKTRQILRKLLDGPLVCEPFQEGGSRGYRFRGRGTYARLLSVRQATNDGGGGQGI